MSDGEKTIVADAAMDAWAMGVVAYELLTRQSAFSLLTEGKESVRCPILVCTGWPPCTYPACRP